MEATEKWMAKWKPKLAINKNAFIQEKNENRINDRDSITRLVPDNIYLGVEGNFYNFNFLCKFRSL